MAIETMKSMYKVAYSVFKNRSECSFYITMVKLYFSWFNLLDGTHHTHYFVRPLYDILSTIAENINQLANTLTDSTFLVFLILLILSSAYMVLMMKLPFAVTDNEILWLKIDFKLNVLFYCTIWPCLTIDDYYYYNNKKVSDEFFLHLVRALLGLMLKYELVRFNSRLIGNRLIESQTRITNISIKFSFQSQDYNAFRML